jgi:hypothetical protein
MNFLELINKCLLELNYKQVNTFAELVKNDHKKIKTILNIVNQEICNTENWNFLLRKATITIPANTAEISNTINGRILYVFIDGEKYNYTDDIELFIKGNSKSHTYSIFNDKLLFPLFKEDKNIQIIYYTRNSAKGQNNEEKDEMTVETDSSLIPMPFAQQLLVYGTCLRVKANPSYIRFNYWISMYKEALLNLRSKTSVYAKDSSSVRLFRQ